MAVVSETVLFEAKLAHNGFVLDLNRSLMVTGEKLPAPWNLPSRLFQFPIEVGDADADGNRRLGVKHPALVNHPFVQRVAETVGQPLDLNGAPNKYGVREGQHASWHHAVDLVSAGLWRELLDTREFTSSDLIANAVCFSLSSKGGSDGKHLAIADAREILSEIGFAAPAEAVGHMCAHLEAPELKTHSNGSAWFVSSPHGTASADRAWSLVLGLEAGWLAHDRSGWLCWTQKGRDRFAAGPADTFTESATGQIAFAF